MRKLGDHPHVVTVLDTGEDDGNPFIVSRYMPGGDVEGLLAAAGGHLEVAARRRDRRRRHPRARARARARHRPPRPEAGERLARRRRPRPARRLRPGHHRGPLAGQRRHAGRHRRLPAARAGARARPPGPASDLYSLGALLYEMLTGQPPFPGDDAVSIISQHLHADPVPPSRHNPEVPEALDRAVLALLAKRPEERPANAAEARELTLDALEEKPDEDAEARPRTRSRASPAASSSAASASSTSCARPSDGALGGPRLAAAAGRRAGHRQDAGRPRSSRPTRSVSGARVYWGRCHEDEGAPAYWPWVQAIRSYARDADPVALAWQLGGGAAEVAQLVPEVAERLDIEPAERVRQRGGALPALRLGHQPAARGGARPAAGARPRRPALGGRALAAPAPLRGAGSSPRAACWSSAPTATSSSAATIRSPGCSARSRASRAAARSRCAASRSAPSSATSR